ncbi:penicillin-binding protein 1A [Pararhizobium mangrovi]|uniref:Penicillin-binding protein 1A n=1 Tax=Pararhizobium mangrovi TaxID=2590452 RepID=A0A506UEE1_9HYPH|nr:penicillin-binding protein 1A [Pararhizobium mangrovi]TPW31235.1 penicillin-binding protein 1A [Pararhizobium mangrovi]
MIRFIGYLFAVGALAFFVVAGGLAIYVQNVTDDLPDYTVLANYEPPVATRLHAADGELMAEYAHQRRLYLPIQAIPDRVKAAFISAEDKNFYSHPGIDPAGILRAMATNVENLGRDRRLVGASTITQQVAKNFLLSSDQTFARKIREAVLSMRIEHAYSKNRILELYLNEIYFGHRAYGIAGAALTYFNKSVSALTVPEMAYLAGIVKGPANYDPFEDTRQAIDRRNYVIDRMAENGYLSTKEAATAKKQPLGVKFQHPGSYLPVADYFTSAVRKDIIDRYGRKALYEGGLSVRTTLDPNLQRMARAALRKGLEAYDQRQGYRGPVKTIDLGDDWGKALHAVKGLNDVPEWRLAVVLDASTSGVKIGLEPGTTAAGKADDERRTGTIRPQDMKWAYHVVSKGHRRNANSPDDVLSKGDVVYVEPEKGDDGTIRYALRQPPKVQGGLVAMDPHTGRVLALVGGFSYDQSQFNRATQAERQPGSSFKPIVYAAALDNGYSPSTLVLDAPIDVRTVSGQLWQPKNYANEQAGPATLRFGLVHSRNLMTVRLARDMGMKLVSQYAENFGVYDHLPPLLPNSLGSSETTVLRMVSAYSVFANGGRQIHPSMIDRVQDRYGRTIYKHDQRICEGCDAKDWHGQNEPKIVDKREQVLDPMTAYQITSILEGVVQRGTASHGVHMDRPVAGKTGTTNDEKDAWFVGYTPDLVTGVYIGYDQPKPMGHGATGGALAAPVFNTFMNNALKGTKPQDFHEPQGLLAMRIDRKTGMAPTPGDQNVMTEFFKPGTGPSQTYSVIGMGDGMASGAQITDVSPQAERAISSGSGGLY